MPTTTEKKTRQSSMLTQPTGRTPYGGSSTIALPNSPSSSSSRTSSMNRTDSKSSRMTRCAKNRLRCISNVWMASSRSLFNRRINPKRWLGLTRVWGQVRGPNSWTLQEQRLPKPRFSCRKSWPQNLHQMSRRWRSYASIASACVHNSRKTKITSRRSRISLNTSRFVICCARKTWTATMSRLRRRNSFTTCTMFRAR